MPFPALVASNDLPLAAYVCTDQGADVSRDVIRRTGAKDSAVRGGGLSGAARLSIGKPIARTIITEIGNISVPMACESVSEIRKTGAEVIVLGHQTDIGTYRALRNAGALEYFSFPVSADEILAIQSQKTANSPGPAPVATPCIGVLGSNGGVGASLLAQNLAYFAASPKGANLRTALVDADLRFGTQAIDLDVDDTPGLQEALSAPDRIDATFIGATMHEVNARLSLYSHQIRTQQGIADLERAFPRLAVPLKAEFDAVIFDLPRGALFTQSELPPVIEKLIIVIPAGYSGVNASSRLISRIKETSPELTIIPVVSELRRDAGLSTKEIGKAIGQDIVGSLPRCDKEMARAQRAARPLVERQPRGAYARAVKSIWDAAAASQKAKADPKKRSGIRAWLG
ncbi:hypothetical protein LOM8899_03082 [Flavimaricola marinus]|uniref:Septum site-determining protein MinD n=2 Tax=Flavimaricola marinus TaxID=1819565 RepID=A0A238LHA7_9RHOB|nr:hypothetical protein LOM8899_03082 [Flavimaricola marinus]